jgi:hypothetical protein
MGQVLQLAIQLTQEDCGECGGVFAVNTAYRQRCYDEGKKTFACPYCKTDWGWTGRGRLQVAEQALAAERQRLQAALARENAERAEREKLARKLKRVGRGTCPECNRSFQNLARHMNCKHGGVDGKFGKPKLP